MIKSIPLIRTKINKDLERQLMPSFSGPAGSSPAGSCRRLYGIPPGMPMQWQYRIRIFTFPVLMGQNAAGGIHPVMKYRSIPIQGPEKTIGLNARPVYRMTRWIEEIPAHPPGTPRGLSHGNAEQHLCNPVRIHSQSPAQKTSRGQNQETGPDFNRSCPG